MKRSHIQLLLVALVCLGPVALAYVLYYYGEPRGLPRLVNEERRLVDPAVPLPPIGGRTASGLAVSEVWPSAGWSLIYARTSPCDERCRSELVRLWQVHAALGRDRARVQRVYLGPDPGDALGADASLVVATFDGTAGERLRALLESIGEAPGPDGRIFVADPHGNLVLSYPPSPEQRGLHDDLERLLDVSRIG